MIIENESGERMIVEHLVQVHDRRRIVFFAHNGRQPGFGMARARLPCSPGDQWHSVVGFDDVPVARYLRPALTTVRVPIEQIGREGVRQLVCLNRGQQADVLVMLRTELVIRESCGCAPI